MGAILLAATILLAIYVTTAFAQQGTGTIRVSVSGNDTPGCGSAINPCRTIQYAHASLVSTDTTIKVASGAYDSLTVTKTVNIQGAFRDRNWITPNIQANPTSVDSLTLTDGSLTWNGISVTGVFAQPGGTFRQIQMVSGTAGFPNDDGVILDPGPQDLGATEVEQWAGTEGCTSVSGETLRRCLKVTTGITNPQTYTVTVHLWQSDVTTSSGNLEDVKVWAWSGTTWITQPIVARSALTMTQPQTVTFLSDYKSNKYVFREGQPEGIPTAVVLTSFAAIGGKSAITLTWETAMEINNRGFNLYRSEAPDGPYVKLNDTIIPSQSPGAIFGATYTWIDEDVQPGITYYYELEDIGLNGTYAMNGPVAASTSVSPNSVMLVNIKTGGASIWWSLSVAVLFICAGGAILLWRRR